MQAATCSSGATPVYTNSETPIEEHLEPKMEPLLTLNTSLLILLPSVLLNLCSCLFFCIMVLLLGPFTIREIISVLSLSGNHPLVSLFSPLSSIFSISGFIVIIWYLCPSVVSAGVLIALFVSFSVHH